MRVLSGEISDEVPAWFVGTVGVLFVIAIVAILAHAWWVRRKP